MATSPTITDPTVVELDERVELKRPLSVNIQPILESVAGKLADDEIDQWFVGFARANEGRGFYLELTAEGELIINPMVNMDSGIAEGETIADVAIWARQNGGRAPSSRTIVRLPDGTRAEPDASWLSPEQLVLLGPISSRAITVCPTFVAEIMSGTDTLPPLQRKMERYITNGAQLGWLIDPYRRRVYVYRPDVETEALEDPETVSGDPVMTGFVFEVRRRIFSLYETAAE
jgi:Uma2 family endonuclease